MAKGKSSIDSSKDKNANEQKVQAFKISMTVVYNGTDMTSNALADDVFNSMTSVGKGLALLHVDSVRKVGNPQQAVAKILAEASAQSQGSMSIKTASNGARFVAINEK